MVTADKVSGDDQYVEYDVTGKVRKVFFDAAKTIPNVEYQYDDRVFRLAKIDYQAKRTTWYIRDASGNVTSVYEQTGVLLDAVQPLEWVSLSNIVNTNGTLSVTAGATAGTANTINQIPANKDGYLEYTLSDANKAKYIGLRIPGTTTRYYFEISSSFNLITMRRSGASQGGFNYGVGSKIRLEKTGDQLKFLLNGDIKLTLTIAAAQPLEVYISLNVPTATILDGTLVFKTIDPAPPAPTLTLKEIPVYCAGKLGTYYPQEEGSVAYEITDHLGNVRALVRDHVNVYTATMEDNGQPEASNARVEEMRYFDNLFETAWTDARMNHTPTDAATVATPANSAFLYWHDGGGAYPVGDVDERSIGPAIGLKVNPGDIVDLETWVRYEKKIQDDEEQPYSSGLTLATLSQVLGSSLAYKAGFESFTAAQATTALNAGLTLGGFLGATEGNEQDIPFAYLNYMLFDTNNELVDAGWQRVTTDAGFLPGQENPAVRPHVRLKFDHPIKVTEAGSIYIWVSNESEDVKVWFDDLKVEHSTSLVVQATDYGTWGEVLREQKSEDRDYRFGYQGQFAERDVEIGWNHFELREYDAVIGRFTTKDPARQFFSPYVGMGNNPVLSFDPNGGYNPVYNSEGYYRGNTTEGFTGEVLIYDGDADFSQMSAGDLIKSGGINFDNANLSGMAQSRIYTHIVDGMSLFDGMIFKASDLYNGAVSIDRPQNGVYTNYNDGEGRYQWNTVRREDGTKTTKLKITARNYQFETTVENIRSTLGVHEYYGHGKRHWGDDTNDHFMNYEFTIDSPYWNGTTPKYKNMTSGLLNDYYNKANVPQAARKIP